MNFSFSKIVPAGIRLARTSKASFAKTASRSFGSIIAHQTATPSATFKTQSRSSSSSANTLAECLSTEITSELAEDEVDHEFLDAKRQTEKLFAIHDTKGEGVVTLKRQFGSEAIEVTFDCQDEAEMDMDDMEEPEDENAAATEEDDEDEGPSMEYGINFDVTITKPAGEKIVVNCVASRKLIVRSVRHLVAGKEVGDVGAYAGPIFEQLNVELQDGFYSHLAERGIDDDLCFFVLSYSRVKEQGEYANWLNKVLEFVEKK